MIWLAVAVAGALGAACRYTLDYAITVRVGGQLPWGTALVNVTGSLLAGVLAGLTASAVTTPELEIVVAGGLLGAYTTFSTAMYESMRLLEDGARLLTLVNVLVPLAGSVLAASGGWWLAITAAGGA